MIIRGARVRSSSRTAGPLHRRTKRRALCVVYRVSHLPLALRLSHISPSYATPVSQLPLEYNLLSSLYPATPVDHPCCSPSVCVSSLFACSTVPRDTCCFCGVLRAHGCDAQRVVRPRSEDRRRVVRRDGDSTLRTSTVWTVRLPLHSA